MRRWHIAAGFALGVGVLSAALVVSGMPAVQTARLPAAPPPVERTSTAAKTAENKPSTDTDTLVIAFRGQQSDPAAAAMVAVKEAAWSQAEATVTGAKKLRSDAASVTLDKSLTRKQAERIAASAAKVGGVRYAEPSANFYPTDAGGSGYSWNLQAVNASSAWSTTRGKGVVVGVIDTGIADNPGLPKALLAKPTRGSTVAGTTWPRLKVTINYTASDGTAKTTATTADTNGNWALTLTPAAKDGSVVTLGVADSSGNKTSASVEVDASVALTVEPSNGGQIRGTAEQGATVKVTYPSGPPSQVQAIDGTWQVTPPSQLQHDAKVTIVATDALGNTKTVELRIDREKPLPPVAEPSNGKQIRGTAEAAATITVTKGHLELCATKVDQQGGYVCVLNPNLGDSTSVEVTATDAAGNTSDPTTVKIDAIAPEAPQVDQYNASAISGTAEADSGITLEYPGGLTQSTKASGGNWAVTPPVTLSHHSLVRVWANDAAGNTSAATLVVIDAIRPARPVPADPTNGRTVNGIAEPGTKLVVSYAGVDGSQHSKSATAAGADGSWTVTLRPTAVDGSQVSITATDLAGNKSKVATAHVDASAPTAPSVPISNGKLIRVLGVEAGATRAVVDSDQQVVPGTWGATTDEQGAWVFTPTTPLAENDQIWVTLTDKVGNRSEPVAVQIDTTAPAAPQVSSAAPTLVEGTSEKGTIITVNYLDEDDQAHTVSATTDSTDWAIELTPAAKADSELAVTATDAAGNLSAETKAAVSDPEQNRESNPALETSSTSGTKQGSQATAASVTNASLEAADLEQSTTAGTVLPGHDFFGDGKGHPDSDATDPGLLINATASTVFSSHGTHVAGIVAAGQQSAPLSGVAPGAQILPIRVLGSVNGRITGDMLQVADALRWGAGLEVEDTATNPYPADVLNLSLTQTLSYCPSYLQEAIDDATGRGVSVVVSAGNNDSSISNSAPANCKNVIVVTATNYGGSRASYTNWGTSATSGSWLIAAPGGSGESGTCIAWYYDGSLSAAKTCTGYVVSSAKNVWQPMYGTSMAAPHVAGAAALLKSLDKSFTPATIAKYLRSTATPLSDGCPTGICGSGVVDATRAVTAASGSKPLTVSSGQYPKLTVQLSKDSAPGVPARVGSVLKAAASSSYAPPQYLWLRDGKAIPGATGPSYRTGVADYRRRVSVRVTASVGGTSATSSSYLIQAGYLGQVARPTVSGTLRSGKKLTAKPGSWAAKPGVKPMKVSTKYQWLRNGKTISKATKSTYQLTGKDKGKKISVRVTVSATGYWAASASSSASTVQR